MRNKLAIIAIAILAVPLALYFVPYAYAASTVTTYEVVSSPVAIAPGDTNAGYALCTGATDVVTGGGFEMNALGGTNYPPVVQTSYPFTQSGHNGWLVWVEDPDLSGALSNSYNVYAECMTPTTIAGIGVPQFGQLYTAIALGALVFYLLGRYMRRSKELGMSLPNAPVRSS